MAKLVGTYKVLVTGVDVGRSKADKDILKLTLQAADEYINDQYVELQTKVSIPWYGSLGRSVNKSGKSPAQITVETLRSAFDFKGGFNDLHDLMFAQAQAVCEDHDAGNFTRVRYLNNLKGGVKSQGNALVEFSNDVIDDLESIFNNVK